MERPIQDLWVGIFVVAGVIALFVLALKVGDVGSSFDSGDSYVLKAEFDNIGGLKIRGPVKSAGVVVGRVSDVSFDTKKYAALVTMRLDKRYQFPKDTTASILTAGLLGEQYVGLEAGGDAKMLANGEEMKFTQSAVVLEQLIGQFLFNKAADGGGDKAASTAKAPGAQAPAATNNPAHPDPGF